VCVKERVGERESESEKDATRLQHSQLPIALAVLLPPRTAVCVSVCVCESVCECVCVCVCVCYCVCVCVYACV